ncbi:MAG: anaerobic ribonucleoside-triphosphate reductase activating protein [Spirochaetota bacterium]
MKIKGIQKTSLVDYPGRLSTVLFFGGCNFSCGYCHNPELARNDNNLNSYSESDVLNLLKDRKSLVDSVVITGGEPTLFQELSPFLEKIKEISLFIKIDTNGSNPDVIENLLNRKIPDYIAIDIKTSPQKYKLAAGVNIDFNKIIKTIELVKESGIDYEVRTTCVPSYVNIDDFISIKNEIGNVKKYFLQQFVNSNTLDPSLHECTPYTESVLNEFKDYVKNFSGFCGIRGI